jgi:hypothetical protein
MSRLSPQTVWRRIAVDSRQPAKTSIAAFAQIVRPSRNLMRRLLSAKRTPARLRLIVAQKYDMTLKEVQAAPGPPEKWAR